MDIQKIDDIIDKRGADKKELIQILLDIQHEYRWISKEAITRVSERLRVPPSLILRTVSLHKSFSLIPKGKYDIHVCNGTSCHTRGSGKIIKKIQEVVGIQPGETDPEMKFSLEAVTCMGCCSPGPVMVVNGKHYMEMTPELVEETLKEYQ